MYYVSLLETEVSEGVIWTCNSRENVFRRDLLISSMYVRSINISSSRA